jgi:transglutaminase-like putative cysteine protease/predicted Zn-dependent protease
VIVKGIGKCCLRVALAGCAIAIAFRAEASPWNAAHFSIEAKALFAEASSMESADGADVVVLDDEESYTFDAAGNTMHGEYVVYKVLSQGAVAGWSGISHQWEPWHEDRPVMRARVIRPDGTVYQLDPKLITDSPVEQDSAEIYSDRRESRAPLPGVAPGSVVEKEILTTSRILFPGAGSAAHVYFGRPVKVQHSRLTVEAPESLPVHFKIQLLPGLQQQDSVVNGMHRLVFDMGAMQALEDPEPNLPSDVPAYPSIDLSTTGEWRNVAEQYAAIVDGRIAQADVRALVEGLVRGKEARLDRIKSILDFINGDVRYTGVEFGEAAIVPRTPTETLNSKYGDCKDKATLLVAMLRAADIPAHLALLNAGSRLDIHADLPAADFFDHAIVYVPGETELWIDATAKYTRVGEVPDQDQGRLALVVRPGSNALLQIPEASSQDNVVMEERDFDLANYGPARVVETSRPRGSFESSYRDIYADSKNKDTLKNLGDYMKSQYLADGLDGMERSDPADLGSQFELRIESKHAKRGTTDLDAAVAVIRLGGLFEFVPKALKETEEADAKGPTLGKCMADFQLRRAFSVDWQYRIAPPPGFEASALPKDASIPLGPFALTETFGTDADGTVHARLRFDSVKRRLSAIEARAAREKITELLDAEPIMIRFQPIGQALLGQGKTRESFQSYRDLIARHPQDAVYHLRMAKALLAGGLGEAARAQARMAVKLDAKSALAQATLADILEYDLVGRKWQPGSDYAGAVAAFRSAEKIEPDNKEYVANLAILLEYSAEGVRYGSGADLNSAIAEYRKLTPAELADEGLQNNLPYALFYASRFSEAQKALDALNPQPEALALACQAALYGLQAAIARAGQQSSSEEQVKQNLRTAGDMLERLRLYPVAADVLQAGASGENAVATTNIAATLRKVRRREELRYGDTAQELVMQFFATVLLDSKASAKSLESLLSRNGRTGGAETGGNGPSVDQMAIRQIRARLVRSGISPEVTADVFPQVVTPRLDGDDATGYRDILQLPGGKTETFFLVKEDGHYRLLCTGEDLAPLGLEVLDRIAGNSLATARSLLDWARDEQHLGGGDDPLDGLAFPRMWSKGQDADAQRMSLAAAALLAQSASTASRGVAQLEKALGPSVDPADRINLDVALLAGYENLQNNQRLLEVAAELAQSHPESERVFIAQTNALRALGRLDEADELARRRLARTPDDVTATRALASSGIARGDYKAAYELLQGLADQGKAAARELNLLAWYSLYFDRVGGPDVESAIKASQLSQNNPAILHTLASAYAAAGKAKESHDVLIHAMDLQSLDEPNADFWYVFGRLAELYGENQAALDFYARVTKPDLAVKIPGSSYLLAQSRIKLLNASTTGMHG